MTAIMQLYVFVLAGFVGFLVIARVPPLLHTPLMSAANFISAISIVGAILTAGRHELLAQILGFVAVLCATINVVAGFVVTDRILGMFQRKPTAKDAAKSDGQKVEA
jgi:H+-translocating NAD(P) transhydrogenase subunit alpha